MRVFILYFFLLAFFPLNHAHNYLIEPRPYQNLYKRTKNCKGIYCNTGCQLREFGAGGNSKENPDKIYKRGDEITVKYTRNNHRGGFLRIALVPVEHMWSQPWHERMTIMHGCWETGQYNCGSGPCGTDKSKLAFRKSLRIPDVFPDGDYVLGHVWYGGIEFTRSRGFFGDFFSCSHVRVEGGNPLSTTPYVPYWDPGSGEFVQNGMCHTSSDAVGVCGNEGCPSTKAFWSIPRVFQNGKTPRSITPGDVNENFRESTAKQDSSKDSSRADPRRFKDVDEKTNDKGICDDEICCASSCGICGGKRCHQRDGGWKCCRRAIGRTGRRCSTHGAPCIV